MFKSFIAWLDFYISRETPASVLKSLVGLMAFAGLLGTIFGNQAIRVGAFVVVIVFVVLVILLLLADRRHLQQRYGVTRELLTRYCDFVVDNSSKPLVSVEAWNQVVYIQPNGDVNEVITIKATAIRERVYFIRMPAGSRWDQPERYRSNVQVVARSLTVNHSAGPRWIVTTSWISARKLTAILHLHEPIKQGEEIRYEVVRTWPAKCRPLMRDNVAESFTYSASKLHDIRHVAYKIVLPGEFDAVHEPIGHLEPDVHLSVEGEYDQEGRRVFTWRTDLVPAGKVVGIRLELSGSRP
ncbi:hypothetical protein [Actinophytocola sp.]|uniref:hypothetical protein n=1 Tax=Actinophytocola sp. TaxID=1872138 RepID=UPI003D6B139D